MNQKRIHNKKCTACNQWTDGKQNTCSSCGEILDKEWKKEIEKRKMVNPLALPLIKINPEDSLGMRIWKRVIHFHQLVFFMLVSWVVWFAYSFVH